MGYLRGNLPILIGALVIGGLFGLVHNYFHEFLGMGLVPNLVGSVAYGVLAVGVYYFATEGRNNKFSPIVALGFFVILFAWHTLMMGVLGLGIFESLGHMDRNVIMFGFGVGTTLAGVYVSDWTTPNKTVAAAPA